MSIGAGLIVIGCAVVCLFRGHWAMSLLLFMAAFGVFR